MSGPYFFSPSSIAMLTTLQTPLVKMLEYAITTTPVDFGIVNPTGGYRTPEMQYKLYCEGKSNCDGVNTKSHHQSGWAVDVFAYDQGEAIWDGYYMTLLAAHLLQAASRFGLVLEWGGFWNNPDCPHFQVLGTFESRKIDYIKL